MTDVIDMWAPLFPTPGIVEHIAANFPDEMLGYIRVFWKDAPEQASIQARASAFSMSEEDAIAALDAAGIDRAMITGFDEKGSCGKTFIPNDLVAGLAERHPGRFLPFAGADVASGMEGVRELERCVRERRFRGLSVRPFMIDLPCDHRRYYPFYAKCVELGVPVSIHSSANWTSCRISDLGHPRHIDQIAADFPELQIIVSHAGYPWVLETTLLAWKYENVWLELSAHRPRYLAEPGTGWEPLLRFGKTTVREKVLWGSGWFLVGRPPATLVAEMGELPIGDEVRAAWMGGNARRLFDEIVTG